MARQRPKRKSLPAKPPEVRSSSSDEQDEEDFECPICELDVEDGCDLPKTGLQCSKCKVWLHACCLIPAFGKMNGTAIQSALNVFEDLHVTLLCDNCIKVSKSCVNMH